MDRGLAERLNALDKQAGILQKARGAYSLKEASRKHFEAKLIRAAEGRSNAEKTTNAHATEEWLKFSQELSDLEDKFEFEKMKFGILERAWLSEHATYKIEEGMIRKQGS